MTFLALSRNELGDVLHRFVPLTLRGVAVLVVGVSAYLVWKQWSWSARPGEKTPRILWGFFGALALLVYSIWRWS